MGDAYKYTDLMCSLPPCRQLFTAKITPVSRIQLEKRLLMLEESDHQDIQILGDILD